MRYDMTTPCDACPFLKKHARAFRMERLLQFAAGELVCHKTAELVEDDEGGSEYREKAGDASQHCAGALIFNEKRETPHQMMRIAERLGEYDCTKLNAAARSRVR